MKRKHSLILVVALVVVMVLILRRRASAAEPVSVSVGPITGLTVVP